MQTIVGLLGTAFLGAVGFVVSLSNRVSQVEARYEDLLTLIDSRFKDVDKQLNRIEQALKGHE
jgi:ribosome-associated translation inhibitor RaiA